MKAELRNTQRKIPLSRASLGKDCLKALRGMGLSGGPEVFVLFCGVKRIRTLNRLHRGKDGPTDVLSFPMYEAGEIPRKGRYMLGDVVISPAIALRQARENRVALRDELRRLMVHGLLHLAGFDHEKGPRASARMRKAEDDMLKRLRRD